MQQEQIQKQVSVFTSAILQIVPWDFPLMLTVMKAAAALACGCTVMVKTSEKSPLSAVALCKLIQKAVRLLF